MPYRNSEKAKADALERSRRHRARKREEKYGPNAPDQRGLHNIVPSGANHYRWNERPITSHGYVLVRVFKDHPMHVANGYAYEHRMVVSEQLGRWLSSDEVVHHINGDKADNRPENLGVMRRDEHNRLHILEENRRDMTTGQFVGKHAAGRLLDGRTWDEFPTERRESVTADEQIKDEDGNVRPMTAAERAAWGER